MLNPVLDPYVFYLWTVVWDYLNRYPEPFIEINISIGHHA